MSLTLLPPSPLHHQTPQRTKPGHPSAPRCPQAPNPAGTVTQRLSPPPPLPATAGELPEAAPRPCPHPFPRPPSRCPRPGTRPAPRAVSAPALPRPQRTARPRRAPRPPVAIATGPSAVGAAGARCPGKREVRGKRLWDGLGFAKMRCQAEILKL